MNFNALSEHYENKSLIQKGAAEFLFDMLALKKGESVLDVGCGTGNLTSRIGTITCSPVVGIDCAEAMINEARKRYVGAIDFRVMAAEALPFQEEFDAVFSNSAFQWFKDPVPMVKSIARSLKRGGRAGIQAPGGGNYCEQFMRAIQAVERHGKTGPVFRTWRNPWFMPETEAEYAAVFENAGLRIAYCRILDVRSQHSLEDAWAIFSSGAIAGYLDPRYYSCTIPDSYKDDFETIVRDSFQREACASGFLELHFRRLYLLAFKD